jgi:hypothetical protein
VAEKLQQLAAEKEGHMKIRTEHVYPPIPIRSFDYSAVDDETYDGPGSPVGRGATEQEAIQDLEEQLGVRLQPLPCAAQDAHGDECRAEAEHECNYCGRGVCIKCALACYSCGEQLHDECRDDHAKETGHQVDSPRKSGEPQPIVAILDQPAEFADVLCALLDIAPFASNAIEAEIHQRATAMIMGMGRA